MRCLFFSWIVCLYNWRVTSSSLRHPCCLSFNLPPWKQQKKNWKKKFNFAFTSTQKLKFYNSLIFSRWLNEKCCLLHHSSSPFMWRKYGDMKRSRRWQDKTIRFFSVVELTKKIFKKFIVVQNNNNNNYNSLINWYKWNFFKLLALFPSSRLYFFCRHLCKKKKKEKKSFFF